MPSVAPPFLSPSWGGLTWSPFVPLSKLSSHAVPRGGGLYRVRINGQDALAYIGQTSRLRGRLRYDLARPVLGPDPPWNDPHTAAPALWAYRHEDGLRYAVSYAALDASKRHRRGAEDLLLWRYRTDRGASPLANHGHFHPGYVRPSNKKAGRAMVRRDGGSGNSTTPSAPPLAHEGRLPVAPGWMSLAWSPFVAPTALASLPTGPALYRIADAAGTSLVYLGQTGRLRQRLRAHARNGRLRSAERASFHQLPTGTPKVWRLEWESDLLGGYYHQQRTPPARQYGQR